MMGKGKQQELLQVYRFLFGEVGRNRRNERLLKEAATQVATAAELARDARTEIEVLRTELGYERRAAGYNAQEAQRAKALDVILADERDDADEAALWLEAIAILAEPDTFHIEPDSSNFPSLCLACGGDKSRGAGLDEEDGEGGIACWVCWYDNDIHPVVSERSALWFGDGVRDFPRLDLKRAP